MSGSSASFEELYLRSRRRLLLQAYALTGDLDASRRAVREAFVVARHHWRRVSGLPDPEEWIRPRAWSMAQRRHVTRPWHREKGLSEEERAILAALHSLSDKQRKALLLDEVSPLSRAEIGQELGVRPDEVAQLFDEAREKYVERTGAAPDGIRRSLDRLTPVVASVALPRPGLLERRGRTRRRLVGTSGLVGVLVVTLLGGWFLTQGSGDAGPTGAAPAEDPVTRSMLLSADEVSLLGPRQHWRVRSTDDNTSGSGINSVCQDARFADPRGIDTLVRRFRTTQGPPRTLVQTVEMSASTKAAESAYDTTLGWFAGCEEARLQLLNAYRVRGLGDEARLLRLRIPGKVSRTYVVGVVRTGSLTVSTVVRAVGSPSPGAVITAGVLTRAVRNLCSSPAAGSCPHRTRVAPMLPPPSGEEPGMLAAADLPPVGKVNRPWHGTDAEPARTNLAATTCDKTDFGKAGAAHAVSRTYVIPEARLPRRFGLTETVGTFGRAGPAKALVRRIVAAMAGCEKKDLGAEVSSAIVQPDGYRGSEYALWRLDSEISDDETVSYWMGVARVGKSVAQVTFTPVGANDIDQETFRALMTRARDRLFELREER